MIKGVQDQGTILRSEKVMEVTGGEHYFTILTTLNLTPVTVVLC
jgi:hypothetical protein